MVSAPAREGLERRLPVGDGSVPLRFIGAHYDAFGMFGANPGADDNASGTAGLLELARLLAAAPRRWRAASTSSPSPSRSRPSSAAEAMGSRVHARALRAAGVQVEAMVGSR